MINETLPGNLAPSSPGSGFLLGYNTSGIGTLLLLGTNLSITGNTLNVAGNAGTVTSVQVVGANGLTFSGGPITNSGSITMGGVLGIAGGGNNITTYTTGDILYASSTNILSKLGIAAAGNVLISGSTPSWNKVVLGTHTSGVTPVNQGGTNTVSYTAGDILYASGPTILSTRPIGATGQVLTVVAGQPTWATPAGGGGITNTAADLELAMSDGVNLLPSGLFVKVAGVGVASNLTLGTNATTGNRAITAINNTNSSVLSLLSDSGIIQLGAPGGGNVTTLRTSTTGGTRATLTLQFGGLGSGNNPAFLFTSATAAGWDGSINTQYLMQYTANIASQTGTAAFSMHSSTLSVSGRTATGKAYVFTYGIGGSGDKFNMSANAVLELGNAITAPTIGTGALTSTNQIYGKQVNSSSELFAMNELGIETCLTTLQFNRQTANYIIALSDAGKDIEMNEAGANTVTVPLNATIAFSIGTVIGVNQYGAGQTAFVAAGGVTIRSDSGFLKIASRYSGAVLKKVGTDEWYLQGNLVA